MGEKSEKRPLPKETAIFMAQDGVNRWKDGVSRRNFLDHLWLRQETYTTDKLLEVAQELVPAIVNEGGKFSEGDRELARQRANFLITVAAIETAERRKEEREREE